MDADSFLIFTVIAFQAEAVELTSGLYVYTVRSSLTPGCVCCLLEGKGWLLSELWLRVWWTVTTEKHRKERLHVPQRPLSKTRPELCQSNFHNGIHLQREKSMFPNLWWTEKEIHGKQILLSYFIGPSGTLTFCHSVLTGGHRKAAALVAFDRLQCSWPTQLGENLCSRAWL